MSQRRRRPIRLAISLGLVCAAAPLAAQPSAPEAFGEVVEVRTGFVRFFLPRGAPPPRDQDLEVVAGRTPQRILRVVGGAADGLELAIAVDLSSSFHRWFAPLRAEALAIAESALGADDRVLAIGFGADAQVVAEGRGQAMLVLAMIPDRPAPAGEGTAFFEAIDLALGRFANADPRAALIVVSDGCNSVKTPLDADTVARRARHRGIPVFLLLPGFGPCRLEVCAQNVEGEWRCSTEAADARGRRPSADRFPNPAANYWLRKAERSSSDPQVTFQRDRFAALIEEGGGGAFVVGDAAEWPSTLREIFDRLSRQWTVVFEPSSEEVRSDEVRVYARIDGQRRRLH